MATLTLFSKRKVKGRIGSLTLDAVIREEHEYNNEITDYPVEDGFNINDHIQRQPEILVLEAIQTLTPFQDDADPIARDDNSDRVQNAYNQLISYMGYTPPKQSGIEPTKITEPVLVDVVTGLKTYTDMAIASLSVPRSSRTSNSLNFTARFKKVRKVQPELTFVPKVSTLGGKAPNIDNQAAKNVNGGKQSTETVAQDSILYNFFFGEGNSEQFRPGAQ